MVLLYRFFLHGFVEDIIHRQLLGLSRSFGLALSLAAYLLTLCIPPFLLGRRNPYHPVWSGLECLTVYAATAAVVGWLCALFASDGWRALGALVAGGEAWAAVGSLLVVSGAFLGAAAAGSRSTGTRGQGARRATRRGSHDGD